MRVYKNFPDEERLQAAVVIPSYDEGDAILPTINAWVCQSISSEVRMALFVVINNSSKPSSKVKDSNRMTHELMMAFIEGGEDPRKFEEKSWQEFTRLKNMIREFRFRLVLVDLWSKGNAPRKCNVGMARDLGAREACKYLSEDGFLVMTDADTVPQGKYLYHADKILKVSPKVAALKGAVYVKDWCDHEENERILSKDCVNDLQVIMQRAARIYYLQKPDRKPFPHLPGSNTVVTKEAYLSVGGIPHINGAEDTELSRKILRAGDVIREVGDFLEVQTSSRVSLRTEKGHGLGQAMKEASDYQQIPWQTPVLPFEACLFLETLLESVAFANSRYSSEKSDWKEGIQACLRKAGEELLEPDELDRLWNANQSDPTLQDIHFNRVFLIEADRIAEEIFGKIPFFSAWKDFISHLCSLESSQNDRLTFPKFDLVYHVVVPMDFLIQVRCEMRDIHRFLKKKTQQLTDGSWGKQIKSVAEKPSGITGDEPHFQWVFSFAVFLQSFFKKAH